MTRARDHLTIFTRAHQPASEFLADAGLVRTNPELNLDHAAALAAALLAREVSKD